MDNTRNYILDRLKSRTVSVEEFNFDALQAPPLAMFLTPADIQEITSIALSLKLSARPDERYKLIDQVMNRRGMIRFLSGTNRASYRHPEFPNILFKVATDAVGIKDNPAEFYNQQFLKPFVPKMFEVSPGGAVAIEEKVEPITSREEFLSVADDIFELITEWLVGEYVLADFGTKFFMNYGIRKGFGCVILDFPYVYKLDGNKLFCNKPDHSSPTGKCEGIIDYDAGYNFLRCTKCGATYKAKELERKIKNNEIISSIEGESKMNIIIKGGSKELKERKMNTVLGDNPNFKEAVSYVGNVMGETMTRESVTETYDKETDTAIRVRTSRSVKIVAEEPLPVPEVIEYPVVKPVVPVVTKVEEPEPEETPTPVIAIPVVKSEKTNEPNVKVEPAENVAEEEVEEKRLSVNGVSSRATASMSPVEFDDSLKEEDYEPTTVVTSPVKDIEICINKIFSSLGMIDIDVVKDDIIERLFLAIVSVLPNNEKSLAMLISAAKDIIDADGVDCTVDPDTIKDVESICNGLGINTVSCDNEGEPDCNTDEDEDEYCCKDTCEEERSFVSLTKILENNNISFVELLTGRIMNLSDIFPSAEPQKIIALFDSNDNCIVTDKGSMLAVDVVDDALVQDISLVSTEYLDSLEDFVEAAKSISESEEADTTEEDSPEADVAAEIGVMSGDTKLEV